MVDKLEMPPLRHPSCHCKNLEQQEMDTLTLQITNEVRDLVSFNCGRLGMCDRSAVLVLVMAAHSLLAWDGMGDEQVDKEVNEAVETFRKHRAVMKPIIEAMQEAPPPANQN